MAQRLDQLTGPVVVGTYYLVPTVTAEWFGKASAWPVIGPQHNDAQCLSFDHQHYHLDARFMPKAGDEEWYWRSVMAAPLMTSDRVNPAGLPQPVLRRRLCRRAANPFNDRILAAIAESRATTWRCHFEQWAGKQARHDGRGWVCPHQNVPLADHAAVDGVITCPLHLLRINAQTGVVEAGPIDRKAAKV